MAAVLWVPKMSVWVMSARAERVDWKWVVWINPPHLLCFKRIELKTLFQHWGPLSATFVIYCCSRLSLLHLGVTDQGSTAQSRVGRRCFGIERLALRIEGGNCVRGKSEEGMKRCWNRQHGFTELLEGGQEAAPCSKDTQIGTNSQNLFNTHSVLFAQALSEIQLLLLHWWLFLTKWKGVLGPAFLPLHLNPCPGVFVLS